MAHKTYDWRGVKVLELTLPFVKEPLVIMSLKTALKIDKDIIELEKLAYEPPKEGE